MKTRMKTKFLIAGIALSALIGFSFISGIESENISSSSEQMATLNIGDKAPELEYSDPSGKMRKLSGLKGKVVLIDFWASWCRPCRMENPNVVKTYNKYKDQKFVNGKGFEVFSVSLDQNKSSWENAIAKDGLVWDGHVSDLKGWKADGAKIYNVNSIPSAFLIDGDGVIIAKNLRGEALDNALNKLLIK
jgi:thiol-disulfide isomerase/thioredoxin